MSKSKKPAGHPAKQDPAIAKMYRTMRSTVELVQELEDRLDPGQLLYLKASAAGLMFNYAALTGLPSPIEVLTEDKERHHVPDRQ